MHVAGGEVEALGAGRRHDMRGVAGQEHPPEPHRLGDEAAQRRDALFDRGPGDEMVDRLRIQPPLQFVPESVVRPLIDVIVEAALHVIAAAVHRAHGAKRKSPRVIGVDQFVADRRRLRQDPEPAERIDPLEGLDRRRLDAGAADAVKAVAAGDEVAGDLVADAVLDVSDARMIGVEIMRLDVAGLVDRGEAGACRARPSGRGSPRSGHRSSRSCRWPAFMSMRWRAPPNASSMPSWTRPSRCSRAPAPTSSSCVDRALFEHAGADPRQHIVRSSGAPE